MMSCRGYSSTQPHCRLDESGEVNTVINAEELYCPGFSTARWTGTSVGAVEGDYLHVEFVSCSSKRIEGDGVQEALQVIIVDLKEECRLVAEAQGDSVSPRASVNRCLSSSWRRCENQLPLVAEVAE